MRILANENIPGETVDALRQRGHDVAWVRTEALGSSDREVLQRAQAEGRIVITFDKDFGELAFRFGLSASSGVVLLRIRAPDPATMTRIAVAGLEARTDWPGHFSVVGASRIRMVPLPQRAT